MSRTGTVLTSLAANFRQLSFAGWAAASGGLVALLFGAAAWGARLGWFAQPSWVLVAWSLVVVLLGALAIVTTRQLHRLSPGWLAGQLEAIGFRRGALSGHLEPAVAGTSAGLLASADQLQAAELATRAPEYVERLIAPFRRRALQGGATLLAGALLLVSARPTHGRAALLWHPGEAWESTVAPLAIALSQNEVDRGARVDVLVRARGREHAILWVRAPGEAWRGQGLTLDSAGRATTTLGPLEADLFVRLTSGGRASDTLHVTVRIPAFLGSLSVTARYPRYLGLEDEAIPTHGDTVVVPEGTRLETEGEATAALAGAGWTAAGSKVSLSVDGARFRGVFTPSGAKTWLLALGTASGQPLVGDTIRLPVVTVPDSAPHVDVPVPGADGMVPLNLRVPLIIDAQDDHGLTQVVVESHRISRLGFADPTRQETVALPEGVGNRAILPHELDLNQRGLLPGDTVRFLVRVSDNAPVAHVARSTEYVLRLPTLSEVREAARETANQVSRRLDSITQASKQLERTTEDLSRERPRPNQDPNGTSDQALSFEDAKRAENVAESQAELLKQTEQVKEALEALRQSAEAAGLNDPVWQERLREIQEQLERALTPELRDRLAELQQALKDLDPERARDALEHLAEAQQQLREALERSKELFKRAAIEGDMANLSAEAKELAMQQRQWTQQVQAQDSARAGREEQDLANRADSLGSALEQLSKELASESPEQQAATEQSAERAQQAAAQMRQAAKSASQGKKQEAKQQGQQASEKLDPLSQELKDQQQQMQSEWRKEVVDELDRVLGDASRLAERQLDVATALRRGDTSREVQAQQGAIEEGVERLLEQVKDVAGKNALVSQQSSVALATARDNMQRAREALSNASPNAREGSRRSEEAVDALNAAAYSLLRSRGAVDGAGSGSGLQEAMEQMAQMAQQQGQLGQQAGGMLPQMGQGGGQVQEQLRALAAQQRALSERLERMRAGGQMPGAADMAQEAKELARTMEAGRLDRQTVERQERLFRRMLDAGRTLQGDEKDEKRERQSTTAKDDSIRLPPALRNKLQEGDDRYRMPSWEELQQLSPDERRRVVEYFRRLSETVRSEPVRSEK
jgi:Domain of unknown function (DUF4175)